MNNALLKLAIVTTISSIGLFAADNSLGTWKRNVAKSQSPNANPLTSQTLVREAVPGGVKITSTGVRKDGTKSNMTYTVKYDGKFVSVPAGATYDSIAVKQVDANTFTSETKKTGSKYHMKARTVISADGKTMTLTQKGTGADGKPSNSVIVHEKQ